MSADLFELLGKGFYKALGKRKVHDVGSGAKEEEEKAMKKAKVDAATKDGEVEV